MSNENEKDDNKKETPDVAPPKQPDTEGQRKRFVDHVDLDKHRVRKILNEKLEKK